MKSRFISKYLGDPGHFLANIITFFLFMLVGMQLGIHWRCTSNMDGICSRSRHSQHDEDKTKVATTSKDNLVLVAVITSKSFVSSRVPLILDTWYRTIPGKVIFFSSEQTPPYPGVDLVALPGVTDIYPPQKKSFMAMRYVYENYIDGFEWFMRVDDDIYIKTDKLEHFLRSLDSRKSHFIGQPGMGLKFENDKIGLKPGDNFCMGGPGIILSRTTVMKFVPHIADCLVDLRSNHEDVELGRCIHRFANVSCTWNYEMLHLLYNHPKGTSGYNVSTLETKDFMSAISLHPVKDASVFMNVHRNTIQQRIQDIKTQIWRLSWKYVSWKVRLMKHVVNGNEVEESVDPPGVVDRPMDLRTLARCSNCSWIHFTSGSQYSDLDPNQPVRSLHKMHKETISKVIHHYTMEQDKLSRLLGRYIGPVQFLGGYFTYKPDVGLLYMLDIQYSHHRYRGKKQTKLIRKRLLTVLPEDTWEVVSAHQLADTTVVNFLVPAFEKPAALSTFAAYFKRAFASYNDRITLTIVTGRSKSKSIQKEMSRILSDLVIDFKKVCPLHIVWSQANFSRGGYRSLGARQFKEDDRIFFVDLDMVMSSSVLKRIQQAIIPGKQAYIPVIFSQTDPQYWSDDTQCKDPKNPFCFSEIRGYWRYYGFGMVGLTGGDLKKLKGWDENITGWGKEDVRIFDDIVSSGLQIFRPLDDGLVHIYHGKDCSNLPEDQHVMCVATMSQNTGSYVSMLKKVKKMMDQLGIH